MRPWHEKEAGMKGLPSNPSKTCFPPRNVHWEGNSYSFWPQQCSTSTGWSTGNVIPKDFNSRTVRNLHRFFICLFGSCFSVGFSHVFSYLFVMSQALPSELGCMTMTNLKNFKIYQFLQFPVNLMENCVRNGHLP